MTKTLEEIGPDIWTWDTGAPGRALAISFGVHGNERPPLNAGLALLEELRSGRLEPVRGSLLLIHANPRASAQDRRWTEGGVDLNRCFHPSVLDREPELPELPELYEQARAREVVAALEQSRAEILVDFHCTVEPGRRFLVQHPGVDHSASREVYRMLRAEVLLSDPELEFGGVSLDEWMSTRDRVGICYETGWIEDPENTPEFVRGEMQNVMVGLGLLEGSASRHDEKQLLQLERFIACEAEGFQWCEGVGENLQALAAGTVLGSYGDGREVVLESDRTLIFPKKRPEMVQLGKPLVYLASARV